MVKILIQAPIQRIHQTHRCPIASGRGRSYYIGETVKKGLKVNNLFIYMIATDRDSTSIRGKTNLQYISGGKLLYKSIL